MARVFHETEHQELLYLKTKLQEPLNLHIPSALGALSYYVCLRIDPATVDQFKDVTVHAKLTGLYSTDRGAVRGEGVAGPSTYPSTDGKVWLMLCRINMARGDGIFTFNNVPESIEPTDLLFCTWLRFIELGHADAWIAGQADPQFTLTGVPLGGIGAGRVDICRDGRFRNYSGNNNQDMPFEDPAGLDGAHLSVSFEGVEKVLATSPLGGMQNVPSLMFEPVFPQARLHAPGAFPGIDVDATLSGMLTPHDLKTSSLPAFMIHWRLKNTTKSPVTVGARFAWPNLVGFGGGMGEPERRTGYGDGYYRYWESEPKPTADIVSYTGVAGLRYSNHPSTVATSANGHHYLAVARRPGDGGHVDAVPDAMFGSVSKIITIPPHSQVVVDMALVWEMPHWVDSMGVDRGMYWQNHFPDGRAIVEHILGNASIIRENVRDLQTILRSTTLPEWMWRRLLNCCYPLVTNSVLYRDGRFSINEGPTEMSGVYGTIDQRLGSHAATQLFFPKLNRQELDQFTVVMKPNGEVNHDLGSGHLERGPAGQAWPDIQCSYAIQTARHAWSMGDAAYSKAIWPKAGLALERHGKWADEGKGVAQLGKKSGLGTSYDSYHYEGTTAYMATLWIASLLIGKKWAAEQGDASFVHRADTWIAAAKAKLETDLWNGKFYRAYAGADVPPNENCHGGMLAGEWYARLLAGEDVLPADRLASCAKALVEFQGSEQFAVPPDEVAPDGSTGSLYGWLPYIESFCIAPLAILREPHVLSIWHRMVNHMQGGDKHPCDTRLMYRPQTGEQSWGAYYMTAPASWLVYEALLDFNCSPATGVLRLNPSIEGTFLLVHPRFWAMGSRQNQNVTFEVIRTFGEPSTVWAIETLVNVRPIVDGMMLEAVGEPTSIYQGWALPEAVSLEVGAKIIARYKPDVRK